MMNIFCFQALKKTMFQIITTTNFIYQESSYFLRLLEQDNQQKAPLKNDQLLKDNKKKRLHSFLYFLSGFIGLIVLIIVGYFLFKRYVEKQALREINEEIENYNNHNSISAASNKERNAYSLNNKVYNKNKGSEIESYNEHNNSFDFNHEERMEKIRRKYGNKMLIKILIKQQIDNVIYDKNLGLEYGDNCTICVNNFIDNMEIYRTPCEHIFHKDCFNKYLKKINNKNKLTCPNCNQNLLINKKFLKLRHKSEKEKNKYNELNINNLETDQKEINNVNISTIEADKNVKKVINDIVENDNTIPKKDDHDTVFIVKKRKIEIPQIMKKLSQRDKVKLNVCNPNEFNRINKRVSDEIYINNMDNDNVDNKNEHVYINTINRIDIENDDRMEENLYNSNINNKTKKSNNNRIKFSDVENKIINKRLISKDFNSSRELTENKITFNKTAESNK